MVTSRIISYGGVALVVWALLYLLDYYLTIYGARLYRQTASQIIVLEGSYELTPMFQEDVDRLRLFSKQFYARLIAGVIALFAFWLLATRTVIPVETFALLVGALVLREAPIMLRHARNITLFRARRCSGPLYSGSLAITPYLCGGAVWFCHAIRLSGADRRSLVLGRRCNRLPGGRHYILESRSPGTIHVVEGDGLPHFWLYLSNSIGSATQHAIRNTQHASPRPSNQFLTISTRQHGTFRQDRASLLWNGHMRPDNSEEVQSCWAKKYGMG